MICSTSQFGFRKDRPTELASVYFIDQIRTAIDNGLLTGAIYIDLGKAFDTISQPTLVDKLPDFGITEITKERWTNYLIGRHQRVNFNDRISAQEPLLCSVH